MNKYWKGGSISLIAITLVSLLIIFATLQEGFLHSKIFGRITYSETFTNIFLFILGEEIPQFKDSIYDGLEVPSLTNLALETLTGVKTNNISILLLQEIPGFNVASTEIYIAGEGSNYSNLPIESPPPNFNELLKQEGSNKEEMSGSAQKESDTNSNVKKQRDSTVYIYHSHSWEGYLPLINDKDVKPSDSSSVDINKNVVLVGSMLTDKLKEYGINTVHNQTNAAKALSDKGWDYHNSYTLSREQVETVTSQNNNIEYYFDIHRDSARKENTTTIINEKSYAKLYFVVGQAHKNYEENLKFAEKIHKKLQERYPGLSRGVYLKTKSEGNGVYNQDISNKSLLVEIGGIDNTKKELKYTVDAFAEVFKEVYEGVIKVNAQ